MRRTKEQRIADMEAEAAQLKRKLRMETVAGVKEAVFLGRAIKKWMGEYGNFLGAKPSIWESAEQLEAMANEPEAQL